MGLPLVIIHFSIGFSILNRPAIGVFQFMETPIWQPFPHWVAGVMVAQPAGREAPNFSINNSWVVEWFGGDSRPETITQLVIYGALWCSCDFMIHMMQLMKAHQNNIKTSLNPQCLVGSAWQAIARAGLEYPCPHWMSSEIGAPLITKQATVSLVVISQCTETNLGFGPLPHFGTPNASFLCLSHENTSTPSQYTGWHS